MSKTYKLPCHEVFHGDQISHTGKMGEKREDSNSRTIWDCGSPLYDSYEIASLGNLIERNMMLLPSPCGSKRFGLQSSKFRADDDDHHHHRHQGLKVKMEALHKVGFFSNFVGRNLWKRKMVDSEERSDKAKKLRRVLYRFCSSVWSVHKKKLQI